MKRKSISAAQKPDSLKLQRVVAVFSKALEVSVESIKKEDIQDCFVDLNEKYGNIIQNSIINELEKLRSSLEVGH